MKKSNLPLFALFILASILCITMLALPAVFTVAFHYQFGWWMSVPAGMASAIFYLMFTIKLMMQLGVDPKKYL